MKLKLKTGTKMVHVCSDNDENGNPQRGFYAMVDKGEPDRFYQMFWDEGYHGHHAVPEELRDAAYQAVRHDVDIVVYEMLRDHPCIDQLV